MQDDNLEDITPLKLGLTMEDESAIEPLHNKGHVPLSIRWRSYSKRSNLQYFPIQLPYFKLPHKVLEVVITIFEFMEPTFLKQDGGRAYQPSTHVAALDGLRGIASLGVFASHFSLSFLPPEDKYGFGSSQSHRAWYQLPLLRTFHSGVGWVCVFWILSGYVLAKKPIQMIRKQDVKLLDVLTSMVFRRGIRLFMPTFISMGLSFCLMRLGAFETGRKNVRDHSELFAQPAPSPPLLDGFWTQLVDYVKECINLTDAWDGNGNKSQYNPPLWTLTVEFYGSMVLAVVIVGIADLRTWTRITILITLIWSTICAEKFLVVLFIVGILVIELELLIRDFAACPSSVLAPYSPKADNLIPARNDSNKQLKSVSRFSAYTIPQRAALFTPFVIGWFLVGSPIFDFEKTPGYQTFALFIESPFLWQKIGSVFLLSGVLMSPDAQWLFTRPVVLYLGRISYALYVVHANVIFIVLYAILPSVWNVTGGKETRMKFAIGYVISMVATWPLTFCLADMFWRGVDIPSMQFSKWIEAKLKQEKIRRKRY